jgi:hypothetical protein
MPTGRQGCLTLLPDIDVWGLPPPHPDPIAVRAYLASVFFSYYLSKWISIFENRISLCYPPHHVFIG